MIPENPVIFLLDICLCDISKREEKIDRMKNHLRTYRNKILTKNRVQIIKFFNDNIVELKDELNPLYEQRKWFVHGNGIQKSWGEY